MDARSDIFSFGAILYEMLSGQRAFRGDSTPATLAAVINLEPRPLTAIADAVPQPIERLVSRCLRKDLTRRAQHASDVKIALEELRDDSVERRAARAVPTARGRHGWVVGAAAAMVIGLVGTAAWFWPRTVPATCRLSLDATDVAAGVGRESRLLAGRNPGRVRVEAGRRALVERLRAVDRRGRRSAAPRQ